MPKEKNNNLSSYELEHLAGVMRVWGDMFALEQITIEPRLYSRNRKWVVILEEHWPYPEKPVTDTSLLDDRINWAIEKLKNWPGCNRMAYDQFWFDKKIEAEKFITLYTLTWR